MTSVADTLLIDRIDRQLHELGDDRERLLAARAVLTGADAAPKPSPTRRRRPRPRSTEPAAPSYEVVPVGKLIALLRGTDGLSTAALAEVSDGDPALIRELLAERESAGEVRRTGSGSAQRWRLVTDEERIAARVAELETRGG